MKRLNYVPDGIVYINNSYKATYQDFNSDCEALNITQPLTLDNFISYKYGKNVETINTDGHHVPLEDSYVPEELNAIIDKVDLLIEQRQTATGALDTRSPEVKIKQIKILELRKHYDSSEVRTVTYNNHTVLVNTKAIVGSTALRARLRDNVEVTECTWYFDDGSSEVLDLNGITFLNKLIIDKDQNLRKIYNAHKDVINNLDNINDIKTYDVASEIDGLSWL